MGVLEDPSLRRWKWTSITDGVVECCMQRIYDTVDWPINVPAWFIDWTTGLRMYVARRDCDSNLSITHSQFIRVHDGIALQCIVPLYVHPSIGSLVLWGETFPVL